MTKDMTEERMMRLVRVCTFTINEVLDSSWKWMHPEDHYGVNPARFQGYSFDHDKDAAYFQMEKDNVLYGIHTSKELEDVIAPAMCHPECMYSYHSNSKCTARNLTKDEREEALQIILKDADVLIRNVTETFAPYHAKMTEAVRIAKKDDERLSYVLEADGKDIYASVLGKMLYTVSHTEIIDEETFSWDMTAEEIGARLIEMELPYPAEV